MTSVPEIVAFISNLLLPTFFVFCFFVDLQRSEGLDMLLCALRLYNCRCHVDLLLLEPQIEEGTCTFKYSVIQN